jgi:hypothetical protein
MKRIQKLANDLPGHGRKHLLSDPLPALLIKVGQICSPEVLPLGILDMVLLMVLAHPLNLFSCILSNPGVVTVWANDDMAFVGAVFQVWVGSAAPKTRPWTLAATITMRT